MARSARIGLREGIIGTEPCESREKSPAERRCSPAIRFRLDPGCGTLRSGENSRRRDDMRLVAACGWVVVLIGVGALPGRPESGAGPALGAEKMAAPAAARPSALIRVAQ